MPIQTTVKEQLSIEELSALYDRIYDIADRLIKKYNPCNIHTKNGKTICNYKHNVTPKLCCSGCTVWNNGCTIKSLGCKLFLCQAITNKTLKKRFSKLRNYSRKYGLRTVCYLSKERWLKQIKD